MLNLWHEHEFHSDTFFYPFANAIVELANVVVDAILFVLFDAHCPQHKQCMKLFFSLAGRLCIRTEIYLHILIVNAANANHWRNFFSFVRSFFQPFAFGAAMSKCGQRKKVPTGCVSVIITRSTKCAKKVEYKFYLCTMCVFCSIVGFFSLLSLLFVFMEYSAICHGIIWCVSALRKACAHWSGLLIENDEAGVLDTIHAY